MPSSPASGGVLYAANAARLKAFYVEVIGFDVHHADDEYVLLRLPGYELIILVTAESRAAGADNTQPPRRRTQAAFKPVYFVTDLAVARAAAASLGGGMNAVVDEWRFENYMVCDGYDPEGNIFQLRARAS